MNTHAIHAAEARSCAIERDSARPSGQRIRYLRKNDDITVASGQRIRYLTKKPPIYDVYGPIAERKSVSSANRCQNGQLAYPVSVRSPAQTVSPVNRRMRAKQPYFCLTYPRYACTKVPCMERKFGKFCSPQRIQTRPSFVGYLPKVIFCALFAYFCGRSCFLRHFGGIADNFTPRFLTERDTGSK